MTTSFSRSPAGGSDRAGSVRAGVAAAALLALLTGCGSSTTGLGTASRPDEAATNRSKQPVGSRDSVTGGGGGGVSAGSSVGSGGGMTGSGAP